MFVIRGINYILESTEKDKEGQEVTFETYEQANSALDQLKKSLPESLKLEIKEIK